MNELDNFYFRQDEQTKNCFLSLKEIILRQDEKITNAWKYGMPFFCYEGRMFCYLWFHQTYKQPYIGIVEGMRFDEPFLIREKRSRMKIMLLDPNEDLPIQTIETLLQKAINFYRTGEIETKKS
jgi:hypothetical protein